MPSEAYRELIEALEEVDDLESVGRRSQRRLTTGQARAVGRSGVVLLSSHWERFLRAMHAEAVDFLNGHAVDLSKLPLTVWTTDLNYRINSLADMQPSNRSEQLCAFFEEYSWRWGFGPRGVIDAEVSLQWMKAPDPKRVTRLFKMWGVPQIFKRITRAENTRKDLYLNIQTLVEKRNNIAHGDASVEASRSDVRRYARAVKLFAERSDRVLRRRIESAYPGFAPW